MAKEKRNKPTKEQLEKLNRYRMKAAEAARDEITIAEQKRIRKLYKELSKQTAKDIKKYAGMNGVTPELKVVYLEQLQRELEKNIKELNKEIESGLRRAILQTANKTVAEAREMLKGFGMKGVDGLFVNVPKEVVSNIAAGKIYDKDWYLSKVIWGDSKKDIKDIQYIVAQGTAAGKSSYDIAKDLERYVNPDAKKDWDWSKVYPNTKKKVDYNAQRLSRTLITHAYQQSFIATTKDNPFVKSYRWIANGSRACPLCLDLDGAIFEKGDVPLDHPNGACVLEAVLEDIDSIIDKVSDWYKTEDGTYPELDEYAKKLGYDSSKQDVKKTKEEEKRNVIERSIEKAREIFKDMSNDRLEELFLNFEGIHGDEIGRLLANGLGCGDTPKLVDALGKDGTYIARGLIGDNKAGYIEQFKSGELFFGKGIYGNGTYAGYGDEAYNVAYGYANGDTNGIIQSVLPNSAKVVDFKTIAEEHAKFYSTLTDDRDLYLFGDVGRYAISVGYDAITVKENNYIVILNRSILETLK